MKFVLLWACFAALAADNGGPVVDPVELHSGDGFPRGDNGYVFLRRDPGDTRPFAAYRPDGSQAYRRTFPAPVIEAAFDADGTAALVLAHSGVLLLTPAGEELSKLALPGFQPSQIAFAQDHSLWILGSLDIGEDAVRHYTRAGEPLGTFLNRPPIQDTFSRAGKARLAVSRDRVGLYDPGPHEWTEIDFKGNETGRWKLPYPEVDQGNFPEPPPAPRFQEFAFTADGQLFARVFGAGITLQRFDKQTARWQKLGPSGGYLIGSNGDALMLAMSTVPLRVLTLTPPPR